VPVPPLATETGFSWGATDHYPKFALSFVEVTLRTLGQRFQRFSPLLAAPAALLLSQGQAKALIIYNVFESAGNVVVQASGSLDLSSTSNSSLNACGVDGGILSASAAICTGPNITSPAFAITGPASFNGSVNRAPASSVSGILTGFGGAARFFLLDPSYSYNTPIVREPLDKECSRRAHRPDLCLVNILNADRA